MEMTPRRMLLFMGVGAVGALVLSAALEEAGRDVALAVALAAIAVLVASYVRVGLIVMRAYRDGDEARTRAVQHQVRVHFPIVFGAPLVIAAAHPWGLASIAVAFALPTLGQAVFLHAMIIVGFILRRRARTTPSR